MTSSRSRHGMATSTGPKISSWAMRQSLSDAAEDGRAVVDSRRVLRARNPSVQTNLDAGLGLALLDVGAHRLELLVADDRAHVGGLVERIADLERLDLLDQRVHELVVDVLVDEQPGARGAGLALPGEAHGQQHAGRGGVDVLGVAASGNTMFGLLPPSSSDTWASRSPATSPTWRPTSVEPVNETLSTPGCVNSASPTVRPGPVSTLSTPGGRNSLTISAIRRIVSGASSAALRISGVAGGQRRRGLHPGDHQRGVPRQDAGDHAQRFAPGVLQLVVAGRQHGALELAGDAAEVAEQVDQGLRLGPGLGAQRVAGVRRGEQGQLLGARPRERRPRGSSAFCRSLKCSARQAGERGPRRGDRAVDVLGAGAAARGRAPCPDDRANTTSLHSPLAAPTHSPPISIGRSGMSWAVRAESETVVVIEILQLWWSSACGSTQFPVTGS